MTIGLTKRARTAAVACGAAIVLTLAAAPAMAEVHSKSFVLNDWGTVSYIESSTGPRMFLDGWLGADILFSNGDNLPGWWSGKLAGITPFHDMNDWGAVAAKVGIARSPRSSLDCGGEGDCDTADMILVGSRFGMKEITRSGDRPVDNRGIVFCGFDPWVSINNRGQLGFVAELELDGEVFRGDGTTSPDNWECDAGRNERDITLLQSDPDGLDSPGETQNEDEVQVGIFRYSPLRGIQTMAVTGMGLGFFDHEQIWGLTTDRFTLNDRGAMAVMTGTCTGGDPYCDGGTDTGRSIYLLKGPWRRDVVAEGFQVTDFGTMLPAFRIPVLNDRNQVLFHTTLKEIEDDANEEDETSAILWSPASRRGEEPTYDLVLAYDTPVTDGYLGDPGTTVTPKGWTEWGPDLNNNGHAAAIAATLEVDPLDPLDEDESTYGKALYYFDGETTYKVLQEGDTIPDLSDLSGESDIEAWMPFPRVAINDNDTIFFAQANYGDCDTEDFVYGDSSCDPLDEQVRGLACWRPDGLGPRKIIAVGDDVFGGDIDVVKGYQALENFHRMVNNDDEIVLKVYYDFGGEDEDEIVLVLKCPDGASELVGELMTSTK